MDYTPEQLATKRRQLAQDYNEKMKELAEIRKLKSFEIIKLLAVHKTLSKAELFWSATEKGQKEIEIELYCRGLIELIRSLKTECDIKNAESFNQY